MTLKKTAMHKRPKTTIPKTTGRQVADGRLIAGAIKAPQGQTT